MYMFISILYMFRANMCPSSGELTVPVRYLVHVTVCVDDRRLSTQGIALIQLILLMMDTWLPETCKECKAVPLQAREWPRGF